MPLPPHRALGLAAEIIPSPPITPLGPTEDPPSQPADIPPTPNSATSFQTMIQSYTPEHRIYAKIQRLRCLPFESSPLTWPSRTWIWDGEVWNEQGIRSASESVEDVDMEPEVRSDVAGPSTTTTFSRPSTSFSGSRNVSMKIKIGPKSPRSSPNQVIQDWFTRNSPVSSPAESASTGGTIYNQISISPGSSRTKIVIRRSPEQPPTTTHTPLPLPSSAALARITQSNTDDIDVDSEADPEESEDDPADLTPNRRARYPDHHISSRLRHRSMRHANREQRVFTVGGRIKIYFKDDCFVFAILSYWEGGFKARYHITEQYRAMGNTLPSLASPPLGLKMLSGTAMEVGMIRPQPKRSRRSTDSIDLGNEVDEGVEISPSEGQRKKGKLAEEEWRDAYMTRRPSPTLLRVDDAGQSSQNTTVAYPARTLAYIETTHGQYSTNTRTGRRSPLYPDPLDMRDFQQSTALSSHFSPVSSTSSTSTSSTDSWNVQHLEYSDGQSPPASPESPSTEIIHGLGLGLHLGTAGSDWSGSQTSSRAHTPGNQTPIISYDLAREDLNLAAESERLRLCSAIEGLVGQDPVRHTDSEWTPPMRGTGIDDTPSTVADEVLHTPDVEMRELSSPVPGSSKPVDDEEEDPSPRLDKGKGRARDEPRQTRRTWTEEGDSQESLEVMVLEVSRMEARQVGSDNRGPMLQRRINKLNRRIVEMSARLEYAGQTDDDVEMGDTTNDAEYAAQLQQEYEDEAEEEEKAGNQEQKGTVEVKEGSTQIEATGQLKFTYNPYIPTAPQPLLPRQPPAARRLTFDDDGITAPPTRGSVSNLISRSSLFHTDSDTSPRIENIQPRRWNRNSRHGMRNSTRPAPTVPLPINDNLQIIITPPTPSIPLRPEVLGRVELPLYFLADPLEMGGTLNEGEGRGLEVELDVEEILLIDEEEEEEEADAAEIRIGYDTPDSTRVTVLPVREEDSPVSVPQVRRRASADLGGQARVLFGSPVEGGEVEGEEKEEGHMESKTRRVNLLPKIDTTSAIIYTEDDFAISLSPSPPISFSEVEYRTLITYDSGRHPEIDPWLPGELAERLEEEVLRIKQERDRRRLKMIWRVMKMGYEIVIALFFSWLCFGLLVKTWWIVEGGS